MANDRIDLTIRREDPLATDVRRLLEAHLAFANEVTPAPEFVYALDIEGLTSDDVHFFSGRIDGQIIAVGALKEVESGHGEIKSMHTAAEFRGKGVGRLMVEHLLAVARDRGYGRVSLGTGSYDAFLPAPLPVRKHGLPELCAFSPTTATTPEASA